MRYLSIFSILFFCAALNAQSPITINKSTIKVGGVSNEFIYFGAKAGDEINISIKITDKKNRPDDIKEVILARYEGDDLWKEEALVETKKKITIDETGVYFLKLRNSSIWRRMAEVSINRNPAEGDTTSFDHSVKWRLEYDTTFYTVKDTVSLGTDTFVKEIVPITIKRIGKYQNPKTTDNRVVYNVFIPENTVYWYYKVSNFFSESYNVEDAEGFNLAEDLDTNLSEMPWDDFKKYTPSYKTKYTMWSDVVRFNFAYQSSFLQNKDIKMYNTGSATKVKHKVFKIRHMDGESRNQCIGIANKQPGVYVFNNFQAAAVVIDEKFEVVDVKKYRTKSKKVPYLAE